MLKDFVVNQYFQGPDYLISLFFDDFNSAVFLQDSYYTAI